MVERRTCLNCRHFDYAGYCCYKRENRFRPTHADTGFCPAHRLKDSSKKVHIKLRWVKDK